MNTNGAKRGVGAAVGLAISALGSSAVRTDAQTPDRLTVTSIEVPLASGDAYTVEHGVLRVPQNRARPDGPVFELQFHRFPALADADPTTPPIIHLNGGPGWPGLQRQFENEQWLEDNIFPRARFADVVIIGQRGIGTSAPNTMCPRPELENPTQVEDPRVRFEAMLDAARRCRAKWEEEGVDLGGITVIEAANDVRDVVGALGYDRVQIHGGSFGSHWGMTVLRLHPDIVARAVLNGMEGPDHTYDMPGWVLAALERVAADAEASGVFDGRLPPGGVVEGFRDVIARAEARPIAVDLPRRGGREHLSIRLTADDIRGLWGGFTSQSGGHRMRGWPADMIALYEGSYEAAGNAAVRNRAVFGIPTAAFFMLDCGSGISADRLATLLEDPGADVVGPLGAFYHSVCPAWDADLGEAFRENFYTDIPTVIVHGDWDLSTPLENAQELLPYFRDHHFVLVERGTHGALGEALRASDSFRAGLERFMATGDMGGLPDVVTLPELDWVPVADGR
ncbi:MAG: alpha/beta fold hydrolase [Gemmatimonadetes bacterium]|nr:alpha/beta fold hydrolase [Gemmatimonadota bacterium]